MKRRSCIRWSVLPPTRCLLKRECDTCKDYERRRKNKKRKVNYDYASPYKAVGIKANIKPPRRKDDERIRKATAFRQPFMEE